MIYIDGINTLFAIGGIYAAGTFGMDFQEILFFGILLNVTAGIGAALFAWNSNIISMSSIESILACHKCNLILQINDPWSVSVASRISHNLTWMQMDMVTMADDGCTTNSPNVPLVVADVNVHQEEV